MSLSRADMCTYPPHGRDGLLDGSGKESMEIGYGNIVHPFL
jgi:hypothetical protein